MAYTKLRSKAIELRKAGNSYSQIKSELGISKSTLSGWLRDLPLSKTQIRLLRDLSETRIEKFRQTMRAKKQKRFEDLYNDGIKKYIPLTDRELFFAGLFLYWGEGGKTGTGSLDVHNTNPEIIKFTLFWLTEILKVPKINIRVKLHLYSDMDIDKEINFWSKELKISKTQFYRPYIKTSNRSDLTYKGGFGHGTCGIVGGGYKLKLEILATIQALAKYYGNKL